MLCCLQTEFQPPTEGAAPSPSHATANYSPPRSVSPYCPLMIRQKWMKLLARRYAEMARHRRQRAKQTTRLGREEQGTLLRMTPHPTLMNTHEQDITTYPHHRVGLARQRALHDDDQGGRRLGR